MSIDYTGMRWRRKRENILRRDKYLCRECKRYGKTTPADTVHHIVPITINYRLAFINNNLISLCRQCHAKMHDRTNNELTPDGEDWVRRRDWDIRKALGAKEELDD